MVEASTPDIKVNDGTEISFKQLALSRPQTPKTSSKLLIKGELFQENELIIDSTGLKNSLRGKNDGQTFFGITEQKDYKGCYYNDYILNLSNTTNNYNSNYTGRLFDISYSKKTNDYQLYMINNTMYLYYIIEQSFYFEKEKEYMLLLGKVFVTISQKDKSLVLRVEYDNSDECDEYTFTEKEVPIYIGRQKANIVLESPSISKKHAIIDYSKDLNKFFFMDNQSTNGSVCVLKEDDTLKIKGDMKFKLNDNMFHIMEIP